MLLITVAAFLLPAAIMAIPAGKPLTIDEDCYPVSYILTEYTHTKSPSYHFVSFNVQSSYTSDNRANDQIKAGANCEADGTEIHSTGNLCNIGGERVDNLTFDLRAGSGDANYRLHHKWQCNGATWTSENDIKLPFLDCRADDDDTNSKVVKCTSKPVIFAPKNFRKTDEKKSSVETKVAKPIAEPTAKSAGCLKCKAASSL